MKGILDEDTRRLVGRLDTLSICNPRHSEFAVEADATGLRVFGDPGILVNQDQLIHFIGESLALFRRKGMRG